MGQCQRWGKLVKTPWMQVHSKGSLAKKCRIMGNLNHKDQEHKLNNQVESPIFIVISQAISLYVLKGREVLCFRAYTFSMGDRTKQRGFQTNWSDTEWWSQITLNRDEVFNFVFKDLRWKTAWVLFLHWTRKGLTIELYNIIPVIQGLFDNCISMFL